MLKKIRLQTVKILYALLAYAFVVAFFGAGIAAEAAAKVSTSVVGYSGYTNKADETYLTEVLVKGTGFTTAQGMYGGIYVMFGYYKSDGSFGYVNDDATNPIGYVLFVAHKGSSTEGGANGGTIASDGSWSATMKIPGATFIDNEGNSVNCKEQECGILTTAAHGQTLEANNSFTRITFEKIFDTGTVVETQAGSAHSNGYYSSSSESGGLDAVYSDRPATIPDAPNSSLLSESNKGGLEIKAGSKIFKITLSSLVTVTSAATDEDSEETPWVGFFFESDGTFSWGGSWQKPSSSGGFDIAIPDGFLEGGHIVAAVDANGNILGWSNFYYAINDASPAASYSEESSQSNAILITFLISAGVIVLAAIAFVLFYLKKRGILFAKSAEKKSKKA